MYEEASSLIFQGKTDEAIALLDKKNQALKTAADVANETAEEQRQTLEEQKNDAQGYYEYLKSLYDKSSDDQKKSIKSRLTLPKSTRKMRQMNMKRRGREP